MPRIQVLRQEECQQIFTINIMLQSAYISSRNLIRQVTTKYKLTMKVVMDPAYANPKCRHGHPCPNSLKYAAEKAHIHSPITGKKKQVF